LKLDIISIADTASKKSFNKICLLGLVRTSCGTSFRLTATLPPSHPLPYHCARYRGYCSPLPSAAVAAIRLPSPPPSSLSRQMQGVTVHSPSTSSRGRIRPRHGPEASRSSSLLFEATAFQRFATRRRRFGRASVPVPVGAVDDEVEVVSKVLRSRPKTKRAQIRLRPGSSPPLGCFPRPTIDAIIGSPIQQFESSYYRPNLRILRYALRPVMFMLIFRTSLNILLLRQSSYPLNRKIFHPQTTDESPVHKFPRIWSAY
jgi:hypothetical protein